MERALAMRQNDKNWPPLLIPLAAAGASLVLMGLSSRLLRPALLPEDTRAKSRLTEWRLDPVMP